MSNNNLSQILVIQSLSENNVFKDDLSKTVNYADVATLVIRHIKAEPVNLIETVAESIATDVLKNFPLVEKIKVKIHKPQAPLGIEFDDVIVTIKRKR